MTIPACRCVNIAHVLKELEAVLFGGQLLFSTSGDIVQTCQLCCAEEDKMVAASVAAIVADILYLNPRKKTNREFAAA